MSPSGGDLKRHRSELIERADDERKQPAKREGVDSAQHRWRTPLPAGQRVGGSRDEESTNAEQDQSGEPVRERHVVTHRRWRRGRSRGEW